jgi:NADPH:quinone reductase-like Zn-dependent oxidoreductase
MKAAVVHAAGQTPLYEDMPAAVAAQGEWLIAVEAAALYPLVRSRASGRHYSTSGRFPLIAGVDGVGRLEDGRRVYFVLPRAPYGSMAEYSVAPADHCLVLPDALDGVTAAATANPGMSSWAALMERAHLKPGETVLINGATGIAGQLAVQIARHLGARKIIATGRNRHKLALLGADVAIALEDDPKIMEQRFEPEFADGVDVVVDYLWGASAESLLIAGAKAGPEAVPIRFIQVGTASGTDITLPGAVLRSSSIELMGSGIGSVPLPRLIAAVDGVLRTAASHPFHIPIRVASLAEVEQIWPVDDDKRTVFTCRTG